MADYNIDNLMKRCIIEIIENKDTLSDNKQLWFNLTKCMLKNYPVIEVYDLLERAIYETSDKEWFKKKYPKEFFNEDWVYPKKKRSVIKINLKRSRIKKLINDNMKITDVAKSYGLKVKKNMAVCPFHTDKKASLGFNDEKNIFHCFGCGAKGDIIEFVRMIKRKDGRENNS